MVPLPKTEQDFLRWMRSNRPDTIEALRKCGLRLRPIGSGAFREVYHICDFKLVVKIPHNDESVEHTRNEIKFIKDVNKSARFAALRRYMPETLYSDYRGGVIVMRLYDKCKENRFSTMMGEVFCNLLNDTFVNCKWDLDIGWSNVGVKVGGRSVSG